MVKNGLFGFAHTLSSTAPGKKTPFCCDDIFYSCPYFFLICRHGLSDFSCKWPRRSKCTMRSPFALALDLIPHIPLFIYYFGNCDSLLKLFLCMHGLQMSCAPFPPLPAPPPTILSLFFLCVCLRVGVQSWKWRERER